jgi:hypothetical protein
MISDHIEIYFVGCFLSFIAVMGFKVHEGKITFLDILAALFLSIASFTVFAVGLAVLMVHYDFIVWKRKD